MNYDRLAVFCFGGPIYGIGSDLDSAVDDANQWLDNDRQILVEDIEAMGGDMREGSLYYAGITQALVDIVDDEGGDVVYYELVPLKLLVTREEMEHYYNMMTE